LLDALQSLTRKLCFFLGSVCSNLIFIKDEFTQEQLKDETEDQKMTRMLLESKVLSGGVESRFISLFS